MRLHRVSGSGDESGWSGVSDNSIDSEGTILEASSDGLESEIGYRGRTVNRPPKRVLLFKCCWNSTGVCGSYTTKMLTLFTLVTTTVEDSVRSVVCSCFRASVMRSRFT